MLRGTGPVGDRHWGVGERLAAGGTRGRGIRHQGTQALRAGSRGVTVRDQAT